MTTREKMLSIEVKRLLSTLSDHGALHLVEVETDLVQTNFLLSEAIEKLGSSFLAMQKSVGDYQMLVEGILTNSAPPDVAEQLKTAQDEIGKHANAAITCLQFQDMTNQLINRIVRRVNGLRDAFGTLGSNSSDITPDYMVEDIIKVINNISKALEDQSVKLESLLWKAVSQSNMESGDIELF